MTTLNTLMLAASDSFAVSILVKATAALAIALVAARLARRRRAAVRHVLLAAAFGVLIVLPLASISTPPVTLAVTVPSTTVTPPGPVSSEMISTMPDAASRPVAGAPLESTSPWSLREILRAVWLAGVVVLLVPVAIGLWQIGRLRRGATPWLPGETLVRALAAGLGLRRSVAVALHHAVSGPVTAGVFRPLIALPLDAPDWPHDELVRALAHELEHVRRADWMTLCLARVTAAAYWCLPLVWIARRQLVLEAERACDDAVLARDAGLSPSDSTAYAAQLVSLAGRIADEARPRPLAMAGRRDLAVRVRAVLDEHQPRGRAGVTAIVAAGAVAAGVALTLSPLHLVAAQTSDQARPRYDAVTVKECPAIDPPPPTGAGGGGAARGSGAGNVTTSPGHMTIGCSTAEILIRKAYIDGPLLARGRGNADFNNVSGPSAEDHPVVRGGPGWVRSAKFVVEATAPGSADRFTLIGPMLQVLLEARFKLKVRREQEEIPLYALIVAKGGLKITPAECLKFDPAKPPPPEMLQEYDKPPADRDLTKMPCGMVMRRPGGFAVTGVTLAEFAWTLSPRLDRAVIDGTGIKDKFNIALTYTPDESTNSAFGGSPAATPGSPLFKAVEEQLGLKLEPTKGSNGYLVIESIQRPSPDGQERKSS